MGATFWSFDCPLLDAVAVVLGERDDEGNCGLMSLSSAGQRCGRTDGRTKDLVRQWRRISGSIFHGAGCRGGRTEAGGPARAARQGVKKCRRPRLLRLLAQSLNRSPLQLSLNKPSLVFAPSPRYPGQSSFARSGCPQPPSPPSTEQIDKNYLVQSSRPSGP